MSERIIIPELTSLRFIFISMIFFHHVELYPGGGATAVAIFFILGGFSLTVGYKSRIESNQFSYCQFIKKRLIKFYPLHWFLLALFCILFILCNMPVEIKTLLPNFFLVQSFIPFKIFFYSYNSPSWYLCNTVFFTFLFPFILKFLLKFKYKHRLLFLLFLLTNYTILAVFTPKDYWLAILYINPIVRLLDFIIGVYLALFIIDLLNSPKCAIVAKYVQKYTWVVDFGLLLSLGIIVWISLTSWEIQCRSCFYWIPICLMILLVSFRSIFTKGYNILTNRLLMTLGGASFSFYMVHSLCINAVKVFLAHFSLGNNSFIIAPAALITSLVFTFLIKLFFEKPIANWFYKNVM